jgi:hypothetical protein
MNCRTIWAQVCHKGVAYWAAVAALTIAGTLIGHAISESNLWIDVRYWVYHNTMNVARLRGPLYPKRTVLVWITDDQYWKGELGGRVPIKRDFVAKLIDKISLADPAAIAIDFDLRSPVPDGSLIEHADYQRETDLLRAVVSRVARSTPVIVPASVGINDVGEYFRVSQILDTIDHAGLRVREGYLQLPYDKRRVPLSLEMSDRKRLDSFAEAIVGAVDSVAYRRLTEERRNALPFISYMTEQDFKGADKAENRIFDAE